MVCSFNSYGLLIPTLVAFCWTVKYNILRYPHPPAGDTGPNGTKKRPTVGIGQVFHPSLMAASES